MKKLFRIFVCIGLVLAALAQSFYAVSKDASSASQLPKEMMKELELTEADISGLCVREEQTFFVAEGKTVFCYNQASRTAVPVFESDASRLLCALRRARRDAGRGASGWKRAAL